MTPEQRDTFINELLRKVKDEREPQMEREQHLHRQHFEPFDKLLERKAQYCIDQEAAGKPTKYLMAEIQVMDNFREYVAILETLAQSRLDQQMHLVNAAMEARQQATYWKQRWQNAAWWRNAWQELHKTLEIRLNALQK